MMAPRPKEIDVQAAEKYLRERLAAERLMRVNLESAMRKAAEKIVAICYSFRVPVEGFRFSLNPRMEKQINDVFEWLLALINLYRVECAVSTHENTRDEVTKFVRNKKDDELLENYLLQFRREMELLIGAGIFLGIDAVALYRSIGDNLRHPYANKLLADGIEAPVSYGRGRTNSMFTAILVLTTFGVARAWMFNWMLTKRSDGLLGWEVRRGSSYPCEPCDDNCGFHPVTIGDDTMPVPVHPHCCCIAVPIYAEK